MAKSKTTKAARRADEAKTQPVPGDLVIFQGPKTAPAPGTVQLQSLGSLSEKLFGRTVDDVRDDFDRILDQLTAVLSKSFAKVTQGMEIDSVEVKLGFTAEGKLAFVAKAGLDTSVTVKMIRVR